MISPGQMPRLRVVRLRRLAYIRVRRRGARRAKSPIIATAVRDTEPLSFDHGPAEFPIATLRPRAPSSTLTAWAGDLQRWLGERVAFIRPRTIPLIAAMVGMLGTAAAAHYLQQAHGHATRAAMSSTLTTR